MLIQKKQIFSRLEERIHIRDIDYVSLKRNILNSFYYFGGSFISLLIGIFSQPIFSRHLEPYDFAVMGYFAVIQNFFTPLFTLNFTFFYLSSYWNPNIKEGKDLTFHLNFLNVVNTIVALLALILVILYFKLFDVSFPIFPFVLIILANLFLEKYKSYYLIGCRINKRGLNYFIFTALQTIFSTLFGLFFVVVLRGGAFGRMSGYTVSILIVSIIALITFLKRGQFRFSNKIDLQTVKKALKFCYPLILGSYLYYPVNSLDRLLLERIGNTQEFGYYNLGFSLATYAGTFFTTLYMAFEPDFYKFTALRKKKEYFRLAVLYIIIVSSAAILLILVSKSIVAFLTSNRYIEATKYFNLFVISLCLYSIGNMFEQLYNSLESTRLSLYRNAMMALASILLYVPLIKKAEFVGSANARILLFTAYFFIGLTLFTIKFGRRFRSKNNLL